MAAQSLVPALNVDSQLATLERTYRRLQTSLVAAQATHHSLRTMDDADPSRVALAADRVRALVQKLHDARLDMERLEDSLE
jgi:hypothetical protein